MSVNSVLTVIPLTTAKPHSKENTNQRWLCSDTLLPDLLFLFSDFPIRRRCNVFSVSTCLVQLILLSHTSDLYLHVSINKHSPLFPFPLTLRCIFVAKPFQSRLSHFAFKSVDTINVLISDLVQPRFLHNHTVLNLLSWQNDVFNYWCGSRIQTIAFSSHKRKSKLTFLSFLLAATCKSVHPAGSPSGCPMVQLTATPVWMMAFIIFLEPRKAHACAGVHPSTSVVNRVQASWRLDFDIALTF